MSEDKSFNPWGVAVAIVLAGAVIAASIYFSRTGLARPASQGSGEPIKAEVAAAVRHQEGLKQEPGEVVLGSEDAPVTAYVFMDWQCDLCADFYNQVLPQLRREYVDSGKLRIVFKHFPISQRESDAQLAAEAWQCAEGRTDIWAWGGVLLENRKGLTVEKTLELAGRSDIEVSGFKSCVDSHEKLSVVGMGVRAAVATGVTEAPAVVVGDWLIEGSIQYDMIREAIAAELGGDGL